MQLQPNGDRRGLAETPWDVCERLPGHIIHILLRHLLSRSDIELYGWKSGTKKSTKFIRNKKISKIHENHPNFLLAPLRYDLTAADQLGRWGAPRSWSQPGVPLDPSWAWHLLTATASRPHFLENLGIAWHNFLFRFRVFMAWRWLNHKIPSIQLNWWVWTPLPIETNAFPAFLNWQVPQSRCGSGGAGPVEVKIWRREPSCKVGVHKVQTPIFPCNMRTMLQTYPKIKVNIIEYIYICNVVSKYYIIKYNII